MTPRQVLALRRKLGMTQRELAEALGCTENTAWRWEAGMHPVSRPYVRLLKILLDKRPYTA